MTGRTARRAIPAKVLDTLPETVHTGSVFEHVFDDEGNGRG